MAFLPHRRGGKERGGQKRLDGLKRRKCKEEKERKCGGAGQEINYTPVNCCTG